MNMLFNTEKPRFDSHLQSAPAPAARCGCVRVAGARNTAARERRWVPSFRFRRLPWRVCAAAGRERLGSRFLKAPGQAVAAPARRRARNHAQPRACRPRCHSGFLTRTEPLNLPSVPVPFHTVFRQTAHACIVKHKKCRGGLPKSHSLVT